MNMWCIMNKDEIVTVDTLSGVVICKGTGFSKPSKAIVPFDVLDTERKANAYQIGLEVLRRLEEVV